MRQGGQLADFKFSDFIHSFQPGAPRLQFPIAPFETKISFSNQGAIILITTATILALGAIIAVKQYKNS